MKSDVETTTNRLYIWQHRIVSGLGNSGFALEFTKFKSKNAANIAINGNGTKAGPAQVTAEDYGAAYRSEFRSTVSFLMAHGISYDTATEVAQAAWARGWEYRHQVRDPSTITAWANAIALNLYRCSLRSEPRLYTLPDVEGNGYLNSARIDTTRLLAQCSRSDRLLLQRRYLDGYRVKEIADQHGLPESTVRIRLLRARRRAHRWLHPKK